MLKYFEEATTSDPHHPLALLGFANSAFFAGQLSTSTSHSNDIFHRVFVPILHLLPFAFLSRTPRRC